ncbi:hypothetical protein [Bailinhaonella thermotolerans]|uniref:Uncharacterized protein n=1 Tax=Bailinhaonella thermotolerans TaxID=1070861 RepID=A0A3A4AQU9_9ACTN|nr:hypothetical protein [Bailinhaonella thermotolerans]RJL23638.1 hypothetical protein D5H75_32600 [Bailinhaonella thermotolerans]
MKRWLTVGSAALLITLGASQAYAAEAAVAPKKPSGPVEALAKQYSKGTSLRSSHWMTFRSSGQVLARTHQSGKVRVGRYGPVASDRTTKMTVAALGQLAPASRVITINGASYITGGGLEKVLPPDKKWLRVHRNPGSYGDINTADLIDVLEPGTFKTVLARGGRKVGKYSYAGSITVGELQKFSKSFREKSAGITMTAQQRRTPVRWKLWVGADQLPTRMTASYDYTYKRVKGTMTFESTYYAWGKPVSIAAPPESEVADKDDLKDRGPGNIPNLPGMPRLVTTVERL